MISESSRNERLLGLKKMVCRKLEVFICHVISKTLVSGSELCCEMCTQLVCVNQSETLCLAQYTLLQHCSWGLTAWTVASVQISSDPLLRLCCVITVCVITQQAYLTRLLELFKHLVRRIIEILI